MQVEFEPYKKVTFQSHLAFDSADSLVQNIVSGTTPMGMQLQLRLFWGNGVLFRFFNHPPSEALSKELLDGHIIFDHIEYAPMPTYKNQLLSPDNPDVKINVVDISKHVVFGPLSNWINENLVKK
jgi:hypothetical protein